MKNAIFFFRMITMVIMLAFLAVQVLPAQAVSETPVPITPVDGVVLFNKIPVYYFTRAAGAIEYQVNVVDQSTGLTVNKITGPGTCGITYCSLKSTVALSTFRLDTKVDPQYYWQVSARFTSGWGDPSSQANFSVYAKKFNSTFDLDAKNWMGYGNWRRVDPGYFKARGTPGVFTSAIQVEKFTDGYVYDVKMRRRGTPESPDADSPNRLYFNAFPTVLGVDGSWFSGYYFQYTNTGQWSLLKVNNGGSPVSIVNWTDSPYINKFGWNRLTVWVKSPNIYLWMNGIYLGYYPDYFITPGWVGIAMYEEDIDVTPLMVDSAKVVYSSIRPAELSPAIPDLLDPAYLLVP